MRFVIPDLERDTDLLRCDAHQHPRFLTPSPQLARNHRKLQKRLTAALADGACCQLINLLVGGSPIGQIRQAN
jgi:hypothetical protein